MTDEAMEARWNKRVAATRREQALAKESYEQDPKLFMAIKRLKEEGYRIVKLERRNLHPHDEPFLFSIVDEL